jgi:molybdenum cofactor biosynthesis protein MoaC
MNDITHKISTLRIALAQAIVKVSKKETIEAVINGTVPKGDVFTMAKAAALLAVKKTSDVIPDCHPMPIESTSVNSEITNFEIKIFGKQTPEISICPFFKCPIKKSFCYLI